ncbi:MAG: hypothetical protein GXY06_09690 [Clostridiaceae bacterium]|nr:hypothetical protein [Clostridiaceae bacterium]
MTAKERVEQQIQELKVKAIDSRSDCIARQRINQLFDANSFAEFNSSVESRLRNDLFNREPTQGDGVICGYGTINGRLVYAASQDATVYGGSVGYVHAGKIIRTIESALKVGAPFVMMFSTGGARIEEGVAALEGLAGVITALTKARRNIPILSVILGHCPGGLAVAASQSDFLIMNENGGDIFLNSPILYPSNSDDNISIGSAQMHKDTGVASAIMPDEDSCILKAKSYLSYIPVRSGLKRVFSRSAKVSDSPNRSSDILDKYAIDIADGTVPASSIIKEIVDGGKYEEIYTHIGTDIVAAMAFMDGIPVGVIGNESARISRDGMYKAEKLIRICDSFCMPIIFVSHAEGFEIGVGTEKSDILDRTASFVSSLCACRVPRLSLIVGPSIGTAYVCFNSKMLGSDYVFAWPSAEVSVLLPDPAVQILWKNRIAESEDPITARTELIEEFRSEVASADSAASEGHIDEIILPSSSRARIISTLDVLLLEYPMAEKV